MAGEPIGSVNSALQRFVAKIRMVDDASRRVDIAVVEYSTGAQVASSFTPVTQMTEPIALHAGGVSSMGAGVELAIDVMKSRNQLYSSMGTPAYMPWVFMISGSAPTDNIDQAAWKVQDEESKSTSGSMKLFALGVGSYDKTSLFRLTNRVMELTGTDFEGMFNWLAENILAIAAGKIDGDVKLGDLPADARVVQ